MKKKNIFWGLLLLCSAGLIITGQFYNFEVNVFQAILSVLLIVMSITNLFSMNWTFVVMPLTYTLWINRDLLNIQNDLQFWPLMGAGVLASIGLSLLFKRKSYSFHQFRKNHTSFGSYKESGQNEDVVTLSTSFSSSARYLYSSNLEQASLNCSFGALQVYFNQAIPSINGVDVYVSCEFGAIELYIPREWNVSSDVSTTLGAFEEKNTFHTNPEGVPELRIHGDVTLGAVEVHYI